MGRSLEVPAILAVWPWSCCFPSWTSVYLCVPHSSTLAWKIPWMEKSGRLQSMGSLRVGHDWATSLSLFTFMHCRRKWQPSPVFLPGESQGWGSLVGCRLWGRTESDTTEAMQQQQQTKDDIIYSVSLPCIWGKGKDGNKDLRSVLSSGYIISKW